ncbi:MAG: DUF547 domain-containing protein [Adhaeribacter sp.]
MKRNLLIINLLLLLCLPAAAALQAGPVPHSRLTTLLKKHVSPAGAVNYKGLVKDSVQLNQYLKLLSDNPPQKSWSRDEQLAYWINAYNAFTLQLIIRNYPLKSIKDIGSKVKIPFVNTPWDIKFIRIGKETFDLNNIEHGILREKFKEPRIHFAIVCASVSCPRLLNEAYEGKQVQQQLDAQARAFINDKSRNKISPNAAQVSQIFNWFRGDFTRQGTLTEFLNRYSTVKINKNARITYLEYNWNLND